MMPLVGWCVCSGERRWLSRWLRFARARIAPATAPSYEAEASSEAFELSRSDAKEEHEEDLSQSGEAGTDGERRTGRWEEQAEADDSVGRLSEGHEKEEQAANPQHARERETPRMRPREDEGAEAGQAGKHQPVDGDDEEGDVSASPRQASATSYPTQGLP